MVLFLLFGANYEDIGDNVDFNGYVGSYREFKKAQKDGELLDGATIIVDNNNMQLCWRLYDGKWYKE